MYHFKYFSEKPDAKKPQTFQGYWHQAREREAQLIRLKNQVFRVILWIILSVIFAGVMIPW